MIQNKHCAHKVPFTEPCAACEAWEYNPEELHLPTVLGLLGFAGFLIAALAFGAYEVARYAL